MEVLLFKHTDLLLPTVPASDWSNSTFSSYLKSRIHNLVKPSQNFPTSFKLSQLIITKIIVSISKQRYFQIKVMLSSSTNPDIYISKRTANLAFELLSTVRCCIFLFYHILRIVSVIDLIRKHIFTITTGKWI